MKTDWQPRVLDLHRFTQLEGVWQDATPLAKLTRVFEACLDQPGLADRTCQWTLTGELRTVAGTAQAWLHLTVATQLPLTCQRCLGPVEQAVTIDRWFRFVATEALAEAQDDEAEEDLLVTSRQFNLSGLIEDELLMALPLVPRHDTCPGDLKMAVADPGFDAQVPEKVHPFAALAKLRRGAAD